MSFSFLATVELQLIMHYCDAKSLLVLARCNRFSLSAASADFAWRHATFNLRITRDTVDDAADVATSLLRFGFVDVAWRMRTPSQEMIEDDEVDVLMAAPRIRTLDVSRRLGAMLPLKRLFSAPSFRGIKSLILSKHSQIDEKCVRLVFLHLSSTLTTLHFSMLKARALLSVVPKLRSLTSLSVAGSLGSTSNMDAFNSNVHCIHQCMDLRRLSLDDLDWRREINSIESVLSASNLSTLEELTLSRLGDAIADWSPCFPALQTMHRLHTLNICVMGDADPLLAAVWTLLNMLPTLIHLRILFVHSDKECWDAPASARFHDLLRRHPSLRLSLQLRPLDVEMSKSNYHAISWGWKQHHKLFKQIVRQYSDRTEIKIGRILPP
jgi:hypothetical protein